MPKRRASGALNAAKRLRLGGAGTARSALAATRTNAFVAAVRRSAGAAAAGLSRSAILRLAGRLVPGVGYAMTAYEVAKGIIDRFNASNKGKSKYSTVGRYVGRIKRKKLKKRKIDTYLFRGFKNTTEIVGTVSDPDCVYVGHSTSCGYRILTVFLQACLRKLFERTGMRIHNVNQKLEGVSPNSDNWQLQLVIQDASGVETVSSYNLALEESIDTIVGNQAQGTAGTWPNLWNFWINYIGSATATVAGSTQRPTRLQLWRKDGNSGTFWTFDCEICFAEERIHLMIESHLKLQNRTLSAAANADSDDVTNNPVVGKVYEFSSGAPRMKIDGAQIIEGVLDATGVITERAAQLVAAGSGSYREPPEPHVFMNVKRYASVMLQPGQIKKDTLTYRISMPVYNFFERLDWRYDASALATRKSMKMLGKCSLFALEDLINVNGVQNISIAYECNRSEACYLTTHRKRMAQGQFYQQTQSNNPA